MDAVEHRYRSTLRRAAHQDERLQSNAQVFGHRSTMQLIPLCLAKPAHASCAHWSTRSIWANRDWPGSAYTKGVRYRAEARCATDQSTSGDTPKSSPWRQ
eukprot:4716483-Amphidinium_carterae.1